MFEGDNPPVTIPNIDRSGPVAAVFHSQANPFFLAPGRIRNISFFYAHAKDVFEGHSGLQFPDAGQKGIVAFVPQDQAVTSIEKSYRGRDISDGIEKLLIFVLPGRRKFVPLRSVLRVKLLMGGVASGVSVGGAQFARQSRNQARKISPANEVMGAGRHEPRGGFKIDGVGNKNEWKIQIKFIEGCERIGPLKAF